MASTALSTSKAFFACDEPRLKPSYLSQRMAVLD